MAINLGKIYAVWLREIKRFTNSSARMVGSLAQPILFLVVLGGGFSALIPGFNYASFILPGIVTMTILFSSISSGVSIIWDREFGFLKEMLASPTSRENLVIGRTLGGATTAVLQGTLILVFGTWITGTPIPSLMNLAGASSAKPGAASAASITAEKSRLATCATPGQPTRPVVKMRAW